MRQSQRRSQHRKRREVLLTAELLLHRDDLVEAQDACFEAVTQRQEIGAGAKPLEVALADSDPKHVERAGAGEQQVVARSLKVDGGGLDFRVAAVVGAERRERALQPLGIRGVTRGHDFEFEARDRRTAQRSSHAADNDKPNPTANELRDECAKVSQGLGRRGRAGSR